MSSQDCCRRKPCASRQQGSQKSYSFAEGWKRVRHRSLSQEGRDQQEVGCWLSPEACVVDEGQTIRSVTDETDHKTREK